jgi:hypothetical protein|tara:strand:+ start:738 stop:968 length:231 start_codon:yes stop_codon:yes gene_type:complete
MKETAKRVQREKEKLKKGKKLEIWNSDLETLLALLRNRSVLTGKILNSFVSSFFLFAKTLSYNYTLNYNTSLSRPN